MNIQQFVKLRKLNMGKIKGVLKGVAGLTVPAAVGAVTALTGCDTGEAMLMTGAVAGAGLFTTATDFAVKNSVAMATEEHKDGFDPKVLGALFAAGLAVTALGTGISAGIGAGTHKLTTSVINHLQTEHQIEQAVEVEPAPVAAEMQVEQ